MYFHYLYADYINCKLILKCREVVYACQYSLGKSSSTGTDDHTGAYVEKPSTEGQFHTSVIWTHLGIYEAISLGH